MTRDKACALRGAPGIVAAAVVAVVAWGMFIPADAAAQVASPYSSNKFWFRIYPSDDATVSDVERERNDGWADRMRVSPTEMALLQFRKGRRRASSTRAGRRSGWRGRESSAPRAPRNSLDDARPIIAAMAPIGPVAATIAR